MRHADPMDKPRRRAAGRPEGPPDVVRESVPADPASSHLVLDDGSARTATVSEPTGQEHRRRQRPTRQPNDEQPPTTDRVRAEIDTTPQSARPQRTWSGQSSGRDERRRGESPVERSLRALVSTRTTQLPPTVAMRAREVAAPTQADLMAAEQELVIVRRHYVPPMPLTNAGKVNEPRPTENRARLSEEKHSDRRSQPG